MPSARSRISRPTVCIITPARREANTGNWHTAARWARFLRSDFHVEVRQHWNGEPCDLLIALHARRSAASVASYAKSHPDRPLALVLTGTDLYRDIRTSDKAQRSLAWATRLVVLQDRGADALPARHRAKVQVIYQSAPALTHERHRVRTFDVAVVGHLREVKDPLTTMRAAMALPADSQVRVLHAGAALEERYAAAARRTAARTARYRWLGELSRPRARQLMRGAAVLLHPSKMEGGAHVILEAIRSGTPVIASDIDGNIGMLGRGYPGLFPLGDAQRAAQLMQRAASDPAFLRELTQACRARAPLFDPRKERSAVLQLAHQLIHNQPLQKPPTSGRRRTRQ